ncbi:MAG: inner-rane translocator [Thermoleophilia bacterium]|nr:inner-rane translocator [Thermoleophilia bacterium]
MTLERETTTRVKQTPPPPTATSRQSLLGISERFGLLGLLVLVFAFFALNPTSSSIFLSQANLVGLVRNPMVLILVALAVMIPLMVGSFDLSTGAVTGVASIVTAAAMSNFAWPAEAAIILGIFTGFILGVIQGFVIARFHLSAIIVTLASLTLLSGVMAWYTGGQIIASGFPDWFLDFGSLNWFGIPRPAFVVVPIITLLWYVQEFTPVGRQADAIRSNAKAAQLVGIRTDRGIWAAFTAGGTVSGITGVMLVSVSGSTSSTSGPSYLFPAIAAVFLGATVIKTGMPNTLGTIVGVYFVAITVSGLTLLGASSWVSDLFNGAVLFAAAAFSTFFARKRGGGGPALL